MTDNYRCRTGAEGSNVRLKFVLSFAYPNSKQGLWSHVQSQQTILSIPGTQGKTEKHREKGSEDKADCNNRNWNSYLPSY